MPEMILKKERERSLQRRHPWVFSGAVDQVLGDPQPGQTIQVLDARRAYLATAAYSPSSQIRARVWTQDPAEQIDADFFARRIQAALDARAAVGLLPLRPGQHSAVRLIHGESDRLPGLIMDRYGDTLVAQFLSAGADAHKQTIASVLASLTGCANIIERSDADVREIEGLPSLIGTLLGQPAAQTIIHEDGLAFNVDMLRGHKTGFYLDQRQSRAQVGSLAADKDVLNCFCYTGGFSLYAARAGARSVLSLDSSAEALRLAAENAALNNLPASQLEWREADVFTALRKFRDERRSFDLIILDPPKFAATSAQVERASRAYKDINLLAIKLLRPGGLLASFSCSGGIDAALFQKIVAGAALDAAADCQIVGHFHQAADHPVSVHFPEGAYLKGLLLRKAG